MILPQSVGWDSVVLFLKMARSSWEALAWTELTRAVEEKSLLAMTWPAARESGADILDERCMSFFVDCNFKNGGLLLQLYD